MSSNWRVSCRAWLKAPRWARLNQAGVGDASRLEHLVWAGGAARCRRMRLVVKAIRLSRSELVWVNRTWLEISSVLRKASGGSGRCWRRSHCWDVVVVGTLY